MRKRALSILLTLVLCLGMFPAQALAAETADADGPITEEAAVDIEISEDAKTSEDTETPEDMEIPADAEASEDTESPADSETSEDSETFENPETPRVPEKNLTDLEDGFLTAVFTDNGEPEGWSEADEANCYGVAPAALLVLDTPSELEWGRDYHQFIKPEETENGYGEFPGIFSWKLGILRQYRYEVCIYQKTLSGDILIDKAGRWYGGDQLGNVEWNGSRRASCFRFLLEDRESGDYYFTVQALGDGNEYENSAVAVSDVWHYEHPIQQLQAPSRPIFDERRQQFVWTVEDSEFNWLSHKKFFYTPDPSMEPVEIGGVVGSANYGKPYDQSLEENGSGYYSVQVRAISRNIEQMASSEWSERSESVYFAANSSTLADIVKGVSDVSPDWAKQAAIEKVRQMSTTTLANLMAADTDNSGATDNIRKLELLAGTQADVEVSDEIDLDVERISIIGAGLNVDMGQSISLRVDKPDMDTIIPTMYGNTLQFSMNLEDEDGLNVGGGQLVVPVKITLPLPDYINPDFLAILHHHQNGTYEEIFPYVYEDNGQWYATFIVRSFSTFTLAESRYSAEQIPTGVRAYVFVDKEEAAEQVLCALYDKNGKMLGIQTVSKGERNELRFSCETSAGDYLKVLFLNRVFCPIESEWNMKVVKG